jgi:hypothetical protein
MSRTLILFIALLALLPARGLAQTADSPKWDVGGTVGLFQAFPDSQEPGYSQDWYFEGRYAASIGRYWTEHLKTEIEFATTGEGHRYTQRFANAPGVPSSYTYPVDEYFRLNQVYGRVVWQFFENSWVHPYVLGGVSYDIERQRERIGQQFYYTNGPPRPGEPPVLITPAEGRGTRTVNRVGAIAGVGAKFYMTPNAFFNAAFITTHTRPTHTVSLVGGFGIDF